MLKMGINTNAPDTHQQKIRAATEIVANVNVTWTHVETHTSQGRDEVMDDVTEFDELTDKVFDAVLQQCARDKHANLISPRKKHKI